MLGKQKLISVNALILAVLSALLLIAARPAHAQTESVLYTFCSQPNCTDGADAEAGLTFHDGNLYGTTEEGGANFGGTIGAGTVFELSPNGSGGWNETVLHSFCWNCGDGAVPVSPTLLFDSAGNLYGTTAIGGAYGSGVVFELSPVGGNWTESVLYSFCSQPNCTDGADPWGGLVMDSAGNLYGTTGYTGTVFELSPNGSGGWTEQVLFKDCILNQAGLTMDASGNIFGVGCNWVFELSPNGSGGWNRTVIHSFYASKDGNEPEGTPVLDSAGNLYGTTKFGGANNYGVVWKLTPITQGKYRGHWREQILYSFKGGPEDGASTWAGVALDSAGNIYGTTLNGGEYGYANGGSGYGTVFELTSPVSTGEYREKVLWNFNGPDGYEPYGGVILDGAGNLYGTTQSNAFEVTP